MGVLAVVAIVLVLVFVVFKGDDGKATNGTTTNGTTTNGDTKDGDTKDGDTKDKDTKDRDTKDDKGNESAAAEKVVMNFFKSMEKRDVNMLLGTMEPSFLDYLEENLGEDYKQLLDDYFFSEFPEDLKFEFGKFDTKIKGDKATVMIVEGTVTYTDEYGDKVTDEAGDDEMENLLELVRVDGKWYLSQSFLEEMFGM